MTEISPQVDSVEQQQSQNSVSRLIGLIKEKRTAFGIDREEDTSLGSGSKTETSKLKENIRVNSDRVLFYLQEFIEQNRGDNFNSLSDLIKSLNKLTKNSSDHFPDVGDNITFNNISGQIAMIGEDDVIYDYLDSQDNSNLRMLFGANTWDNPTEDLRGKLYLPIIYLY